MNAKLHRLPRADTEPPEIPGYRLGPVIGRGSTCLVYRAVQLAVERDVAIKVLHRELSAKPRVVHRLQREARTLARLRHPHLIAAIDMGEVDGRWWFAMELVDGPSLADRIRSDGPLTEREALRLFLPLCEALECLWEAGVVHRDIKPANVLLELGPRGGVVRARLADLGLAFAGEDPAVTGEGGTLGTPHYISPEQARDPSNVDIRTDLWSFGATLFHALCARPPFTGESLAEVLSAVLHARVPDPQALAPHLGRGMALVLRRCLVRDPEQRYANPRELLEDLERLRERRAPEVTLAQLDPLERSAAPWRRALVWALPALLAVGGVGLVALDPFQAGDTLPLPSAAPAGNQLLERLVAQVHNRPSRLAGAWIELRGLRDAAPDDLGWLEVRAELIARLEAELDLRLRERAEQLRAALARSDFAAARALVSRESLAEGVRSATGFDLAELPPEAARVVDTWSRDHQAEVAAELRQLAEAFGEAVLRYRDGLLLPELERLRARGRWRSALALTELDGAELARRAGLSAEQLPPEELQAATVETRVRLDLERVSLERAWRAQQRELVAWIEGRRAELLRAKESRALGSADTDDLARDFEAELLERGLRRDEVPLGADQEWSQALAAAQEELLAAEQDLAAERAQAGLRLRADVLSPAFRALRRYESAVELWTGFLAQVQAPAQGGGPEPVRERVLEAARGELDAAERLLGLLRRAADRVRAERGRSMELRWGNIRVAGRLDCGADPLADGFILRPAVGEPYRLDLRRVALADLERLARIDGPPADLSPDDRLAAAWLLASEGEDARAGAVLASGALPEARAATALSAHLGQAAAEPVAADQLLRRLDGAAGTDSPLSRRDPAGAAALIEVLLERHLTDPAVALRSTALRVELDRLQRRGEGAAELLAELRQRFGAQAVTSIDARRVRIAVRPRAEGLTVPSGWETLETSWVGGGSEALELELPPPFDPTAGPYSFELGLRGIAGQSAGLFEFEVLGFSLVHDGRGGWWAGTLAGAADGAGRIAAARAGAAEGPVESAVEGGRARVLRVECDRSRGGLRAYLDGRQVVRFDGAPSDLGGALRLRLRSSAPVELSTLEVEGPLR